MKKSKMLSLLTVGLVAGLALGSLGIATAVPVDDATTTETLGVGGRMGAAIHDAAARFVDILADLTGLDLDAIHELRADGASVADIATAEGVDPAAVTDAALSAREAILDEKVADGTIDEAQKDFMLDRMTDRLDERISSTEVGPFGSQGKGGDGSQGMGGGGQGRGGMGGGRGARNGAGDAVPEAN